MVPAMLSSLSMLASTVVGAAEEPTAGSADSGTLDEVVVTANKYEESRQKTAVSVTVVSGDELVAAGVQDLQDMQSKVPNVRFQEEGVQRQVYLRGIGSTNDIPTEEPPNAFNFNGVYMPREATGIALIDIAQVEVIPGPQSTLYGRSALGGTVNIAARRPTDKFELSTVIEGGNYDYANVVGVVNVPVADTAAMRLAGGYAQRTGYLETGSNDRDEAIARLSFLANPIDALSIYLWGSYDKQEGHAVNLVNKGLDPATGAVSNATNDLYLHSNEWDDTIPASFLGPFPAITAGRKDYNTWAVGAEVNYEFGELTLTYLPAYTSVMMDLSYHFTGLPLHFLNRSDQVTNELRLSNAGGGTLKWLVGAYQYSFYSRGSLTAALPGALFGAPGATFFNDIYHDPHSDTKGVAVFGQMTYEVTPGLRLVAGGRYSNDDRDAWGDTDGFFFQSWQGSKTFTSTDWKAGVEYDLAPASMVYLNLQTGSQLGTFRNLPATPTQSNLIDAPKLFSVSAGAKNRFFDDRLEINDEVFYYDYDDFIVSAFDASIGQISANAKKMKIYGNELNIRARATSTIDVDLTVGYLHARYTDFTSPLDPSIKYDGDQAQNSPDWTATLGVAKHFSLQGGAEISARVDSHYESEYWCSYARPIGGQQQDYVKTDASLTYSSASGQWSVALWAKNLENEPVMAASAGGAIPGPVAVFLAPPRTYGLRISARMN